MIRRRRWAAGVLALTAATALLGSCASTTYESVDTQPAISTTTTLPVGPASELLPLLVDEAGSLSGVMIDGGDASEVAADARDLWDAAKQEVGAQRPELLAPFESNVEKLRSAVQFKRAADADKAAKNIASLVAAYLA